MPSSPFSGLPTTHPSFLKHRYNENNQPWSLNVKLTSPTSLPAWASLPTPPMSGTPPPEPPSDPLQSAGRRRKREDSPPSTTQEGPASASTSTNVNISPLGDLAATRYGEPPRAGRPAEPSIMPFPLNLPWEPQPTYGTSVRTAYPQYPAPPLPGRPQISPRATRKTKAHVASACVNCKRKHLRCDETRPCRRCVQSGKEDTCKDVEHKKRGRPPLKPDESSASRLISSGISLPPLGSSSGRVGPGPSLVPLLPTPTPARLPFPPYAAPSIAPSHAVAHGHFATRPPAFPPIQQPTTQLPSTGPMQHYGYSADQGLPTSQYSNPLFPRRPVPSQMPFGSQQGSYGGNPFQLPPILPAPPGTTVDPAIAQQQRHSQPPTMLYGQFSLPPRPATTQAEGRSETGEREAKRPKNGYSRHSGTTKMKSILDCELLGVLECMTKINYS